MKTKLETLLKKLKDYADVTPPFERSRVLKFRGFGPKAVEMLEAAGHIIPDQEFNAKKEARTSFPLDGLKSDIHDELVRLGFRSKQDVKMAIESGDLNLADFESIAWFNHVRRWVGLGNAPELHLEFVNITTLCGRDGNRTNNAELVTCRHCRMFIRARDQHMEKHGLHAAGMAALLDGVDPSSLMRAMHVASLAATYASGERRH